MKRKLPLLAAVLAAALIAVPTALADVWTDQADYTPGSPVTIHGSGYSAFEGINIEVTAPYGQVSGTTDADPDGAFQWSFGLPSDDSAVGTYTYTATGVTSGISQSGSFTDAPKADPVGSSTVVWTGNGVSGGVGGSTCNSTSTDLLTPIPAGKKGWLFVLQQVSGDTTNWR